MGRDLYARSDRSRTFPNEPQVKETVKWFDAKKGFGLFAPDAGATDMYVNRKNLLVGTDLSECDRVEFVCRQGNKGSWAAYVRISE